MTAGTTSTGKPRPIAFSLERHLQPLMTKFLLRDGSLIDVDAEGSEDVFSYTNSNGATIHAALSDEAEVELLKQVPCKLLTVSQRMLLMTLQQTQAVCS